MEHKSKSDVEDFFLALAQFKVVNLVWGVDVVDQL